MAIQISFEAPDGVVYPAAYVRIGKTIIENPRLGEKNVTLEFVVHATKALKNAGKMPVYGPQAIKVEQVAAVQPPVTEPPTPPVMECAVNPDIVKLSELYAWLRLQPMFSGGIDV